MPGAARGRPEGTILSSRLYPHLANYFGIDARQRQVLLSRNPDTSTFLVYILASAADAMTRDAASRLIRTRIGSVI
jgi:hypothetical protein